MIMIELNCRYVFHVPLYRCAGGKLVRIEIDALLDELIGELNDGGFEDFYFTEAKAHYKKRCFDEVLITIFSASSSPLGIFQKWFRRNNEALGQEAFAWECGNSLFIENLI